MILRELFTEGVTQIWSRKGSKNVRKYRCTSGTRKGRIVAKPSTCTAPKNMKQAVSLKRTKSRKASIIKIKSQRTKRANPASRRLVKLNRRKYAGRRRSK